MKNKLVSKTRKAIRKLKPQRKFFYDNAPIENTIFVAGAARSGTTWLQNIINYSFDYRVMFEPFHSGKVSLVKHFNFRQYLQPDNRDSNFLEPTRAILAGKIRNTWVDDFNTNFYVQKRVIKDVRTNLMLKWINRNFPFIPIVLIVRHPCPVAVSRRERGFDTHLDSYLSQDLLMQDHLSEFRSLIENTSSLFEKHILIWCIEHYVLLRQFDQGDLHVLFYEDLCINPYDEVSRLFSFLDFEYNKNSTQLKNSIYMPSPLSRKKSAVVENRDLINDWKNHITDKELDSALNMLKMFGLDVVYSEEAMPVCKDTNQLFK